MSDTPTADAPVLSDEDWLQDLLYRHPTALPVAEIDDTLMPLYLESPEVPLAELKAAI